MAMATPFLTALLFLVFQRIEMLQNRFLTPQERYKLAERQRKEEERREQSVEEDRKRKWYYRRNTWTFISILSILYNFYTIFFTD